ncbi:hypothetical protein K492DRAFT_137687 [Lichtheimia hyalospora FSU 10163]|nr:hypothetical protein K492DRAFT_137687 [Lichtheimia hyalospora FSU 10163]
MKTTTTHVLLSFLILSLVGNHALAQLSAPMRNYNVTSPVSNGPYVVDRILPCTYRLMSDVDSSCMDPYKFALSISSSGSGKNATQPEPIMITDNADVSKTEASAKHDGNMTYYEHSFNFKIPSTVAPGRYNVVFFDASTNTELPIPIEIRSAAPAQSPNGSSGGKTLGGSSNGSSNDGHSQSIFASTAAAAAMSPSFYTLSRVFIMLSIVMFAFTI